MDVQDFAILIGAGFIAVVALVRLMLAHRNRSPVRPSLPKLSTNKNSADKSKVA